MEIGIDLHLDSTRGLTTFNQLFYIPEITGWAVLNCWFETSGESRETMLGELAARNGSPVWIEWADEDFDGVHCALLSPSGKGYAFGGQAPPVENPAKE